MAEPVSLNTHHSFIIRCWRDDAGQLHGSLIDALTHQSYPFSMLDELVRLLDLLSRNTPDGIEDK